MSDEIELVIPAHSESMQVLMPDADAPPEAALAPLSSEQLQAQEAVFQQDAQEKEAAQVAGLLGMWTGTLVLHDLAKDALTSTDHDEDVKTRKKKNWRHPCK